MKQLTALCFFLIISFTSFSQRLSVDEKVDSLLQLMTLDEKIGQMAQAERGALENINDISYYSLGSLLSGGGSSPYSNTQAAWADMYDEYQSVALQSRLGIPLIYGVDAVHGHNNVYGAVIFPHNIGLGCTWNPDLVKTINEITAKEVAATGIDWTFSPCIAVPQNERWGRTYEGFGETAEIQKMMSAASVIGLQSDDLESPETILACAKHFVGDGGTLHGIDQGNTVVTEEVLRALHMTGYIDAIEANVGTVMASYNSWNGQKLHGHDYLLNDVLKDELGFEGFVISDWKGVDQVHEDYREAVKRSVNAGIDMVMVPDRYIYFISILKSLVEDNEVSQERINDAVRRILKQKFLLNLFEEPLTDPSLASSFGSPEHRDVAKQAVRESLVLLNAKNDILPLQMNNQTIMVSGSLANDLGAQCGGWSISWQGANGDITEGTPILEGLQNVTEGSDVIYSEYGDYNGAVDAAIVVIGENPYAEGAGDRSSLHLDQSDIDLVKKIKENGIPVIAVLISGRPMIISEIIPYTDAFITAWLPGTEGEGIAEVLFGAYEPTGKLSHSWPKDMTQVPLNIGDDHYAPLFAYKHGIQGFPSSLSSDNIFPYAAITSVQGNMIFLTLTDVVTNLEYEINDFEIKINDITVPDMISLITISDMDESTLCIELRNSVESSDDKISISYNGSGIYSSELPLNLFNNFYIYNDVSSSVGDHEIPGKIQAENYYEMFGVQTEECEDIGGGLNVGYIETGDWMKYELEVLETGSYNIRSRISGYNQGSFSLSFNDGEQTQVNYSSTNGWQNWQDFNTEINLTRGNFIMKVEANNDGFNINYFDFELVNAVAEIESNIENIMVFPNPVRSEFQLSFQNSKRDHMSIKLYEMSGKMARKLHEGFVDHGTQNYRFLLDPQLPKGLYFIELKDSEKRYFEKVLLQ